MPLKPVYANSTNIDKIQTSTWRIRPGHIRPKTAVNIVERNKSNHFLRKHSAKRELKLSSPEVLLKDITADEYVVSSSVAFPSLLNSMVTPSREEFHKESGGYRRPIFVKSHPVSLTSDNIKSEVIFFKEKALKTQDFKSLLIKQPAENHVYKSKNNKYEFKRRVPEKSISVRGANPIKNS